MKLNNGVGFLLLLLVEASGFQSRLERTGSRKGGRHSHDESALPIIGKQFAARTKLLASSSSSCYDDERVNGSGSYCSSSTALWASSSSSSNSHALNHHDKRVVNGQAPLTHQDIVWRIRPHMQQSRRARLYFLVAARILRIYLKFSNRGSGKMPAVLCPAGGLCQIEAWYQGKKQVGRFGVTTSAGPSVPIVAQQVADLYGGNSNKKDVPAFVPTAAIQYMVVEPEYRKRQIGTLALQVIAYVHAYQSCDFTMLVANDSGSGKLVAWYERHGFQRAPMLQDLLGSPNQEYGVTMIGPTNATLPENCRVEWW